MQFGSRTELYKPVILSPGIQLLQSSLGGNEKFLGFTFIGVSSWYRKNIAYYKYIFILLSWLIDLRPIENSLEFALHFFVTFIFI